MTDIENEAHAREKLTTVEYNELVQLIADNISEHDDVEYLGTFLSENDAIEAFFSEEYGVVSELFEHEAVSINTSAALDFMEYSHDAYVLTDWTQDDSNSYLIQIA